MNYRPGLACVVLCTFPMCQCASVSLLHFASVPVLELCQWAQLPVWAHAHKAVAQQAFCHRLLGYVHTATFRLAARFCSFAKCDHTGTGILSPTHHLNMNPSKPPSPLLGVGQFIRWSISMCLVIDYVQLVPRLSYKECKTMWITFCVDKKCCVSPDIHHGNDQDLFCV